MKILNQYLARSYLTIFGFAVGVFTFILAVGTMIRVMDLLARGISAGLMLRYFALSIPFALQFTVPMSVMTASLLLFMRLSMDGELTAMKACGLSLWQIVSPVLVLAMGLTVMALILTQFVSPRSRYLQRHTIAGFREEDPLALVEEGRFVRDFPNIQLYVGRRENRQLFDIVIYEVDRTGARRNIRARSGTIERDEPGTHLLIDLYDVRIEQTAAAAGRDPPQTRSMTAAHYPRRVPLGDLADQGFVRKRVSDHTWLELREAVRDVKAHFPDLPEDEREAQRMGLVVEASNRAALSFSCFAFTLLGIPLGLRSRRRESSFGVILSIGVAFLFYFVMSMTKTLASRPAFYAEALVWLPVILAEVLGLWLIHRSR